MHAPQLDERMRRHAMSMQMPLAVPGFWFASRLTRQPGPSGGVLFRCTCAPWRCSEARAEGCRGAGVDTRGADVVQERTPHGDEGS